MALQIKKVSEKIMVSLNSDAKNSPDLTTFVTGNLIDFKSDPVAKF